MTVENRAALNGMSRLLAWGLALWMVLSLAGCGSGGEIGSMKVTPWESELYSEQEVQSAIDTAADYFKKEFSGCTLTEITYAGDEESEKEAQYALKNGADEVIVLVSSFTVDESGGDGSLNPNSTYRNFQWILIRKNGGSWQHFDHGY